MAARQRGRAWAQGGSDVYEQCAIINNIIGHAAGPKQAARGNRRRSPPPKLTRNGSCGPRPGRLGHADRQACKSASASPLLSGSGPDRLVLDEGGFVTK